MTTLISFLGKSQLDSKTGYRSARYRFEDGSERETAYFGLALADYLRSGTLILLGTPSSQWDLLVESVVGDAAQEEQRIELLDAVRADSVNEDLLRQLAPSIERKVGRSVQALIIPHAVSFAEQQALLARLAAAIARGERVAIDLTHGYRHLAMLGLAAARYLAHERDIVIEGLYYGALDMTRDGITPVIRLDGLAHVEEWAEAFAAYEAGGDSPASSPCLLATVSRRRPRTPHTGLAESGAYQRARCRPTPAAGSPGARTASCGGFRAIPRALAALPALGNREHALRKAAAARAASPQP